MKRELENKFKSQWPTWFVGLNESTGGCLSYGFECGDGWNELIWRLCEDIEKLNPGEKFRVFQVKEKFGGLRFYVSETNKEVYHCIDGAELESFRICEACGTKEHVISEEGPWIVTLCKDCR